MIAQIDLGARSADIRCNGRFSSLLQPRQRRLPRSSLLQNQTETRHPRPAPSPPPLPTAHPLKAPLGSGCPCPLLLSLASMSSDISMKAFSKRNWTSLSALTPRRYKPVLFGCNSSLLIRGCCVGSSHQSRQALCCLSQSQVWSLLPEQTLRDVQQANLRVRMPINARCLLAASPDLLMACSNCGQSTPLPSHMLHSDGTTPGSPKPLRKPSLRQTSPMVLLCHGCRGSLGGARLGSPAGASVAK